MSTVAFFDLDHTLLNTSSGVVYLQEIIRQRRVPPWIVAYLGLSYRLKLLDLGQTHARLMHHVGRAGHIETAKFFEEWVSRRLHSRLTPAAKAKVAWHQDQGRRVVIISASIEEIVKPIAQHLGLGEDYLCTRLLVKEGRYTGEVDSPHCYGSGKVHWAKLWLAQNGLNFPQDVGYFYTDSPSDLPLLEVAAYPVVVNPSRKFSKIARARGWQIEVW